MREAALRLCRGELPSCLMRETTPYLYRTHLPSDVKAQHDPIRASEVVRNHAPVRLTPAGVPLFPTKTIGQRENDSKSRQ